MCCVQLGKTPCNTHLVTHSLRCPLPTTLYSPPHLTQQALAVMFVWVAVGGVMTAVERLDVAGSRLIISSSPQLAGVDAAAGTKSSSAAELSRGSLLFNRRPSKLGLEAHHMQQQHHHHHHPHTQSLAAVMHRVLGTTTTTSSRGAVSKGQPQLPLHHEPHHQHHRQEQVSQWLQAAQNVVSALLLLPLLKNIAGFWHLQLRQLSSVFVGCCCSRGCSHSTPTPVKTDDGVTRRWALECSYEGAGSGTGYWVCTAASN